MVKPKQNGLIENTYYIGTLEEIVEGTTASRDPFLRLSLRDLRGDTIRCRLWKEIIQDPQRFNRSAIENAPRPAIVAVTSVKITKPFEWIQLGATAATYVYLNPDIPEAAALKDRSHTGSSSLLPTTPIPIISSSVEKKCISELLQFDRQSASGRTFACDASISDIHITTEEGWFKSQCTIGICTLTAYWRDGFWTCPAHWRIAECRHTYHIVTTITDSTGSANAIIYNDAGETIVGSPCSELITTEAIHDPMFLPQAIIQTKKKPFRFHLKVQLYTKLGVTGFNINKAEHIGDTSNPPTTHTTTEREVRNTEATLPPQTPTPTRQPHRQGPTTGVKRSLPTETGPASDNNPPHV
ncbi:hypothetical protein SSX86_033069 [Deinandra increscens subsp. villosa]|uniref:Replication factor A C-terminal domain-containing protein n=1 Tax=Deinandra increscens subsp. villosa TaxID=3103831 RepID=A0AAP0GH40_9ASTR